MLLDLACWQVFRDYEQYEVKRKMQKTNDGKKVEVYYRKMNVICLYN